MRKVILSLSFMLMACVGLTHAQAVFKKYGFNKAPLTLSNGKYNEFFTNDDVVQIGTVKLNTRTNQIVEFLEEDTTKANYKSEFSSRWLSVDPLAEKFPNYSPYVYCANNPVILIDPDGKVWKYSNGKQLTNSQLTNVKVFIFYDPVDFSEQTLKTYNNYVEQYGEGSVALSAVSTESSFIKDWKNMNGKDIKYVELNLHGNNQNLFIDPIAGEYITSTENGHTNISKTSATNVSELPNPSGNIKNAQLNINSCHSLDKSEKNQSPLTGSKLTIGEDFRINFNFNTVRGTTGAVNYNDKGEPTTQWYYFKSWEYLPNSKSVDATTGAN